MQTTIDKFGRVVIPKTIRENLGIQPGVHMEIKEDQDRIILSVDQEKTQLELEEGVLVFTGKIAGDLSDVISRKREERSRRYHF